jgi:hypothetical protein
MLRAEVTHEGLLTEAHGAVLNDAVVRDGFATERRRLGHEQPHGEAPRLLSTRTQGQARVSTKQARRQRPHFGELKAGAGPTINEDGAVLHS